MIEATQRDVDRLFRVRAQQPTIVSTYLTLPTDPRDGLRGLRARVDGLLEHGAAQLDGEPTRSQERSVARTFAAVRELAASHARQWLGHGVAVFAADELDMLDELVLPGPVTATSMLGDRPYIRPLLAAVRRAPTYCTVVVDARHAWLFRMRPGGTEVLAALDDEGVRDATYGGWYGLAEHRVRNRASELARHHLHETVDRLGEALDAPGYDCLAVGGHAEDAPRFVDLLPPRLRQRLAGTFVVDPHTLTPALARQHAAPVVADWVQARESELVARARANPRDALIATSIRSIVPAANERAIDTLLVADDAQASGVVCLSCDALGESGARCAVCGGRTRRVTDIGNELTVRTLAAGGRVEPIPPGNGVLAWLRHGASVGGH